MTKPKNPGSKKSRASNSDSAAFTVSDSQEEAVKKSFGNLPGPGPGRPRGMQNKMTGELKTMIIQALDKAGGVEYLVGQAKDNPKAFLSLLGRVLPLQVSGDPTAPLIIESKLDVSGLSSAALTEILAARDAAQ